MITKLNEYEYEILNEYVTNTALAHHLISKFFESISRYFKIGEPSIHSMAGTRDIKFDMFPENFMNKKLSDEEKEYLKKLINRYLRIFTDNHYIVGYHSNFAGFNFVLKQQYTQRYYPNQGYLYHTTGFKENLLDISRNGLELRSSEQSKDWNHSEDLKYPPAIFATVPPEIWWDTIDERVVKIKTRKLPNKWWYDVNLFHGKFKGKFVLTYEPIPAKYLEFWKEGQWIPANKL